MTDPLIELENALAYMFELQKITKAGKYISPLVQNLKKALDNYKNESSDSLHALVTAVKKAFPVIEKYVDSYQVRQKMEALAGTTGETIEWYTTSRPTHCVQYQFFAATPHAKSNFIAWLSVKSGQNFRTLDLETQAKILIEKRTESEFTTKLSEHLRVDPTFLFNLATVSVDIFIHLMNSRIGFQLERHYIAKAIHHHEPAMIDETLGFGEQIDKLVEFLDKNLSAIGLSVEKLLSDPQAKAELDKSERFQCYQTPEEEREYELNPLKPS